MMVEKRESNGIVGNLMANDLMMINASILTVDPAVIIVVKMLVENLGSKGKNVWESHG